MQFPFLLDKCGNWANPASNLGLLQNQAKPCWHSYESAPRERFTVLTSPQQVMKLVFKACGTCLTSSLVLWDDLYLKMEAMAVLASTCSVKYHTDPWAILHPGILKDCHCGKCGTKLWGEDGLPAVPNLAREEPVNYLGETIPRSFFSQEGYVSPPVGVV